MQHLVWEACHNVRDLGGYPTRSGGQTRSRAFVRADNLARLTPTGREALLDYGVRTILDLRFPEEIKQLPNPFSDPAVRNHTVRYLHLPLQATGEEAEAALRAAKSTLEGYCLAFDYERKPFARVMTAMAEAPEGIVLYHCHAGRDRTGLVSALLLDLADVPSETIVEDYCLTDRLIQPIWQETLKNMKDPGQKERLKRELEKAPETMRGVVDYLHTRYGGAAAYLQAAGMTEEQIEKVRRRLVGE